MFDIPKTMSAYEYAALSQKYGDVVYLNALGKSLLVLSSMEAAQDLLDKRSGNYSSKPPSAMADLIELGWNISLLSNQSDHWRRQRKELHQFLGTASVGQFFPVIERHTRLFLRRLLDNPSHFTDDAHLALGAMIMELTYGIDVKSLDDEYMRLVQEGNDIFMKAFVPGKYLVETFPILKRVPAWFPGAKFRREAAEWKETYTKVRARPFQETMDKFRRGKARSSIAANMTRTAQDEKGRIEPYQDKLTKDVAATVYLAGAETTLTTIRVFFLAMASYPAVQARAQAELDAVLGQERLPTPEDRAQLPYVEAVLKECMRWRPILPLALPHMVLEEDEYRGWRIPAGTVVFANSWVFSRDPAHYPDPETFMPERYLTPDGKPNPSVRDPRSFAFGYGRRLCPGRHLGEAAAFGFIAATLHTFTISPPLDTQGQQRAPSPQFATDFLACPEPFDVILRVRSEAAERLVLAEWGGEECGMES